MYGKPKPELNCDLLSINEPRQLEVIPADRSDVTTYYLRLQEVSLRDVGEYKCSARNELGADVKVVTLTRKTLCGNASP